MSRVPSQGWHLEVDVEQETRQPAIAGDVEWAPSINGLPEATIPIAGGEWLDGRADSADARLWKDGKRLPIERIVDIRRQRGGGQSRLALELEGGVQLRNRIQRVVQNEPAGDVVADLVDNETSYAVTVDDVDGAGEGDPDETTLLAISDSSDLESNLSVVAEDEALGGDTVPLEVDATNDIIERQQTSWLWTAADDANADQHLDEAGNATRETGISDAADNQVIRLEDPDTDEIVTRSQVSLDYTLPEEHFELYVRARETKGNVSEDNLSVVLTGGETGQGDIALADIDDEFGWHLAAPSGGWDFVHDEFGTGQNLGANLEISTGVSAGEWRLDVDALAVVDARFGHKLDNGPDPHLETPAPYGGLADIARLESDDQVSASSLEGARTEIGLADANPDSLEVTARTPEGETTTAGEGEATVDHSVLTDRAAAGLGLAGAGSQDASPASGIDEHRLDSLTLYGLITEERRLIGESFDDDLLAVLQDIAETAGAIWTVAWDSDVDDDGGIHIEWSRPGLRAGDVTLPAEAVDIERDATQQIMAATVVGGRRSRVDEITADHDTAVALSHGRVIPGTERVREDAEGDPDEYEPITDYELDYLDGEVTALSGGDIGDGESLVIEYRQRPEGRFESEAWGGDPLTDSVVEISRVTTTDAAEQAARRVVRETGDVRLEARVDVSRVDPTQSMLEALGIDALDEVAADWRLEGVDAGTGTRSLRLGTAPTLDQLIADIAADIGSVRERV